MEHQGFRKYFANTTWMLIEQILRLIAGFFVGVWVIRYLGPQQFGIFSYILAFVSIFSSIARLGLDSILVRDLVNEPNKRNDYLGTAFWLRFVSSVFMILAIFISSLIMSNDKLTNLYLLIVASGLIFQSFDVIDSYFQSKVQYKFISLCKITQLFISSLIKIYFVITKADLIYFVITYLIDQLTITIAMYFAYKSQNIGEFFFHFNLKKAQKLLSDSWPLILSSIAITIYMRIDQVMIKQLLGNHSLGMYSAAMKVSEVLFIIPVIVANSVTPSIIASRKDNYALYIKKIEILCKSMIIFSLLLAIVITFSSEFLINFLFGQQYYQAAQILVIQSWSCILICMGIVSNIYLIGENWTKKSFYRTSLGAVFNVLLNIILIPTYGVIGAVFATLISQFIVNFAYDFFDKEMDDILRVKINSLFLWR